MCSDAESVFITGKNSNKIYGRALYLKKEKRDKAGH